MENALEVRIYVLYVRIWTSLHMLLYVHIQKFITSSHMCILCAYMNNSIQVRICVFYVHI